MHMLYRNKCNHQAVILKKKMHQIKKFRLKGGETDSAVPSKYTQHHGWSKMDPGDPTLDSGDPTLDSGDPTVLDPDLTCSLLTFLGVFLLIVFKSLWEASISTWFLFINTPMSLSCIWLFLLSWSLLSNMSFLISCFWYRCCCLTLAGVSGITVANSQMTKKHMCYRRK